MNNQDREQGLRGSPEESVSSRDIARPTATAGMNAGLGLDEPTRTNVITAGAIPNPSVRRASLMGRRGQAAG
jgi:hypothetical protein